MHKYLIPILIILTIGLTGCSKNLSTPIPPEQASQTTVLSEINVQPNPTATSSNTETPPTNETPAEVTNPNLAKPLDRAASRITKKPFGIYITPETSPIPREKFRGYHTGTDFEILPGEENSEVTVYAICDGKLLAAQFVSGYGGVMIQACEINEQAVTVLYGHIKLTSIEYRVSEELAAGEQLAVLGQGETRETDSERKQLHLGIHKGTGINYRGYVQAETELNNWIDYQSIYK